MNRVRSIRRSMSWGPGSRGPERNRKIYEKEASGRIRMARRIRTKRIRHTKTQTRRTRSKMTKSSGYKTTKRTGTVQTRI